VCQRTAEKYIRTRCAQATWGRGCIASCALQWQRAGEHAVQGGSPRWLLGTTCAALLSSGGATLVLSTGPGPSCVDSEPARDGASWLWSRVVGHVCQGQYDQRHASCSGCRMRLCMLKCHFGCVSVSTDSRESIDDHLTCTEFTPSSNCKGSFYKSRPAARCTALHHGGFQVIGIHCPHLHPMDNTARQRNTRLWLLPNTCQCSAHGFVWCRLRPNTGTPRPLHNDNSQPACPSASTSLLP
jgi:hypothetical protein